MSPFADHAGSFHRTRRSWPGARTAVALIATTGLSLLAAGCGGSPVGRVAQLGSTATQSTTASSAASAQQHGAIAFAQCMRSNGVPSFPDPDPQGNFPPFHTGVSKQISAAADEACKHLLPSGGTGTPQQRQEKLAFALQVARCLRAHGFPNFPDPTVSGQGTSQSLSGAGIDPSSPQFQATETACEKQARKALGLP